MVNATGWSELFAGNPISAVYVMYDAALMNWTVAILFFVYQLVLLIKTRNITLAWISGLFFASIYVISSFVQKVSLQAMFVLLVFELAGILYLWFFK